MTWLPGVERVPADRDAGAFIDGVPWRAIVHMTEGWSVASAVAAYRAHKGWPYLTASHAEKRVVQHIPFDRAARAAKNLPGGVETNRARAIQVEIVGFSAEAWAAGDDVLRWHADTWLRPLMAAVPIRARALPTVDARDGWIARPDAPQRLSHKDWLAWDGICGHQHVPENDHWDPGRLHLQRLTELAELPTEEDDMTPEQAQMLADVHASIVKRAKGTPGQLIHDYARGAAIAARAAASINTTELAQAIAERLPSSNGPVPIGDLETAFEAALRRLLGSLDD